MARRECAVKVKRHYHLHRHTVTVSQSVTQSVSQSQRVRKKEGWHLALRHLLDSLGGGRHHLPIRVIDTEVFIENKWTIYSKMKRERSGFLNERYRREIRVGVRSRGSTETTATGGTRGERVR